MQTEWGVRNKATGSIFTSYFRMDAPPKEMRTLADAKEGLKAWSEGSQHAWEIVARDIPDWRPLYVIG